MDMWEKGYKQGLFSAADFIQSGLSFEQWYGNGPSEICTGWLLLLNVLEREREFYELRNKLKKEAEENG